MPHKLHLCFRRSSAKCWPWHQRRRPHFLPAGDGVCRKPWDRRRLVVTRRWRWVSEPAQRQSVAVTPSVIHVDGVLLCVCCVPSHGAAVQRGAGFGSGGFAARHGDGVSEIQRRRCPVPPHRHDLWLRTRVNGESLPSTSFPSTLFFKIEFTNTTFFCWCFPGHCSRGRTWSTERASSQPQSIVGRHQFPVGAPPGQWDMRETGRGGAGQEDAALLEAGLWPLWNAQHRSAE